MSHHPGTDALEPKKTQSLQELYKGHSSETGHCCHGQLRRPSQAGACEESPRGLEQRHPESRLRSQHSNKARRGSTERKAAHVSHVFLKTETLLMLIQFFLENKLLCRLVGLTLLLSFKVVFEDSPKSGRLFEDRTDWLLACSQQFHL